MLWKYYSIRHRWGTSTPGEVCRRWERTEGGSRTILSPSQWQQEIKGWGNEIEGPGGSHGRGYGTWRTRERTRQKEGAESSLLRIEAVMWREGFPQNTAEKGRGLRGKPIRGNRDTETEGRQQRLNTVAVSASEERNWGKEKEESMQMSVQRKTQTRKGKSDWSWAT